MGINDILMTGEQLTVAWWYY